MTENLSLKPGDIVPEFEMEAYDPVKDDYTKVSLAANKSQAKWTVLFFYPADFTFVCSTEFAALADQQEEFKKQGAELITVSCDTKHVHNAWRKSEGELQNVKYLMASDTTGKVAKMFGVYDAGSGLALRGTFIIDPKGKLTGSEVNFYNLGRNIDELMRKLQANIYLSQHGDEVCPAKWKHAGDKTLKPSAKIVGKIHEALKG